MKPRQTLKNPEHLKLKKLKKKVPEKKGVGRNPKCTLLSEWSSSGKAVCAW